MTPQLAFPLAQQNTALCVLSGGDNKPPPYPRSPVTSSGPRGADGAAGGTQVLCTAGLCCPLLPSRRAHRTPLSAAKTMPGESTRADAGPERRAGGLGSHFPGNEARFFRARSLEGLCRGHGGQLASRKVVRSSEVTEEKPEKWGHVAETLTFFLSGQKDTRRGGGGWKVTARRPREGGPQPRLARHSSRGGGSGRHPFPWKPRQAALSKPQLSRPCRLGGGVLGDWGCGGEAPDHSPRQRGHRRLGEMFRPTGLRCV